MSRGDLREPCRARPRRLDGLRRGPAGHLSRGRIFFDATAAAKTSKGVPGGLTIDREGRLFAAGPGGVHVLAPDGTRLAIIELDTPVASVGCGGDGSTLFVTAGTAVYRVALATKGLGF